MLIELQKQNEPYEKDLMFEMMWAFEDEKNKYFFCGFEYGGISTKENVKEFVSVAENDSLAGYIAYDIVNNIAAGFRYISFDKTNSTTFALDTKKAIMHAFEIDFVDEIRCDVAKSHPLSERQAHFISLIGGKKLQNNNKDVDFYSMPRDGYIEWCRNREKALD